MKLAGMRLAVVLLLMGLVGCGQGVMLMPTPNLYVGGEVDPFAEVPEGLRNNRVEVVYLTDRVMEGANAVGPVYGHKRSRAVGFGVAEVAIGDDASWEELVKASRTEKRKGVWPVTVRKVVEEGHFPQTPRSFFEGPVAAVAPVHMLGEVRDVEQVAAEGEFHQVLSAQLAKTPVKEVFLFVHGYHNTFEDALITMAQLWHFLGRRGVAVAYCWPAGASGLLRGYTYDSASSEFTVFHLKQMLHAIARCPEVAKVHIFSHSRGTDTTTNALRELYLELQGGGRNTREVLKLGTVVLAAPDMDVDVVIQKATTVRLAEVPERFTMYVSAGDKLLGTSGWLFGGLARLGAIQAESFSAEELAALRAQRRVQIIDARVTTKSFGHDYYLSSPAVSSDLILLLRYQKEAGAEHGRPLRAATNGFWAIEDGYPGKAGK